MTVALLRDGEPGKADALNTRRIPFIKYHGCGNDFVIVDEADVCADGGSEADACAGAGGATNVGAGRKGDGPVLSLDPAGLARRVCHRRLGVGADGLIVCRHTPLTMDIINSDGSVAPMCGNGIRCFARYCVKEGVVEPGVREFDVHTLAGVMRARVCGGDAFTVEIDMGRPDWSARAAGIDEAHVGADGEFVGREVSVGAGERNAGRNEDRGSDPMWAETERRPIRVSSLFLGTYHTVVWLDENEWILADVLDDCHAAEREDPAATGRRGEADAGYGGARVLYASGTIDRVGRALESHPVFTKRTNVDFARVTDRRTVEMITWERGAGLTAACGTGACSVVALGVREGRLDDEGEIRVALPYGELFIRRGESGGMVMRGPAERVFRGEFFA